MNKQILLILILITLTILGIISYVEKDSGKSKPTCESLCYEVSNRIDISLIETYTTNNSGKLPGGCRCEFENGVILGFGLNKSVK